MKIRILPTLWVCAGLLASCGGGDSTKPEGEPSGLGACTPPSASPGAAVVCEVKGISEDCTVFFGGKPVEFVYHPENETVEFMVPPGLPGDKNIYAQCGDSGVKLIEKKFNVPGAGGGDTAEGEAVPPEGTAPAGEQGEVITPSGPGGTTTGGEAPPPDADSDGVADASDACPGTVAGTTVDSKGCPPPPPAPTTATIDKFNVDPVTSGAEMNTVKIEWGFSGAKAAYLWGDFNREAADASLAAAERCKLVGVRHLVTGPDGKKLNTGSDLYNKNLPFLEGTLCDNGNASKDDDCKSASSTTSFRPGRPLEERDLYAVQLEMKEQLSRDYIFEKKDMVAEIGPIIPLFVEETNPDCRIDLAKEDASLITTGTIYTRPLAQHAQFCLAAEGADDLLTVKCKTHEAPEASLSVTTTQLTTKAGDNRPKVKVAFSYANVVSLPSVAAPAGCSPETGASWPALTGATGTLSALCDITTSGDLTTSITATARGIGENNKETKKIVLTLGTPSLTFEWNTDDKAPRLYLDGGGVGTQDDTGKVEFLWRVKRSYAIKDGDTNAVLGSGDTHWIDRVEFIKWNGSTKAVDGPSKTIGPNDDHGIKVTERNHTITGWGIRGYDFGASQPFNVDLATEKPMITWPYDYSFTFSNVKAPECYYFDDCCDDSLERARGGEIKLRGSNLKSVVCSCTNGLGMRDDTILKSINKDSDITVVWDWGSCADRDNDIWWNCTCTAEYLGPDENGNVSKSYPWTWCCEGDDFNEGDRECPNNNNHGDCDDNGGCPGC